MSVWHEPIPPGISHSLQSRNGRVRAVIRRRDHFGGVNTIHFMRRTGDGPPLNPKREPDKWIVLTPRAELSATTLEAAKARALSLMEQIGRGEREDEFIIGLYSPPVRLERVTELDHPAGNIKAIVFKRLDGRHEVRYFVHQLLGLWSHDQTEEWDWVRARWEVATFADDLPSAEEAAQAEMEELASAGAHPSIQQWFRWVGEKAND
jgi:hypothetical protein